MSDARPKKVVRRRTSGAGDDGPEKKRRRSQPSDPAPPDPSILETAQSAGAIIRLTVKNFMCHEHLTFDFNSNVNFVTGQNGSGKSAVVTAVMVGLGGRATITDRGRAITELIRTNQSSAVISVTLRNTGDEAFAQDTYGDAITVERTIRASGASSYRLLNANNQRVTTKKKELTDIMDALNIQVDNPIAILTQETSKNFLRVDDPKKKYMLFLDATRLAHIRRSYDLAATRKRSSENALSEKKECLGALKSQVKECERQVNICKNRQDIGEKIKCLEKNLQWAKVMEKEKISEKAREEHSKKEKEVEVLATKRTQLEDNLERSSEKKAEVQMQKEQLDQQRTEQTRRATQLKNELRELLQRQQAAARRLKDERAKSRNLESERDNLRAEIARQRSETQPDLAAESQRRQEEVRRLEAELKELSAAEKTQQGHMQHVTGSLQKEQDELRQTEVEERERQRKIVELEGQLRRSRENQADPRAVFGPWVAAVDREIETCWQQKRFKKKPIGPIGAYVRLRAGCDEWKPLVETCLASVLRAYLVDDQSDMRVMSDILAKHARNERQKPRVIASKFLSQVHDVSHHGIDTSGEHVSVWSVLDIDHPVVANAVIDQARAESVLLLRTDAEARDTMAFRDRVPRGCAQALTRAGYRYYPDPNYRTYPVNVPHQARFLQVSMQDVIRDLTDQMQNRRAEAQAVTDRLGPARTALRVSQRQERELRKQLEQVRQKKQAVQTKLRQLKSQEEPEPINLQALEDEVTSYTQTIDQLEAAVAPLIEQKEEIDKKVEECKTSCGRAAEEIRSQFSEKLEESLRAELETADRCSEELRSKLSRLRPQLEAKRAELDGLAQTLAAYREQAEQAAAAATAAAGDRMQPAKSVLELESRLRGLKRSMADDSDQQRLSWKEVSEKYQLAQLAYQRTENDVSRMDKELEMLNSMLDERNRNYDTLKRSLANRVTQYFFTILDARNFGGNMQFDHETQKLVIDIRPGQQGGGERAARAPLQLSGGERSFSTLAFVLAMWSAMPSPFRMLDEFDVFMDEVNRKIGHDMLLKNALEHNSQFVFITPLAIPGTHENPRITIHRMRPPLRE